MQSRADWLWAARADVPPRQVTVGLAGSYRGLNAGDEAILTVAVAQPRQASPGVQIVVVGYPLRSTDRDGLQVDHRSREVGRATSAL